MIGEEGEKGCMWMCWRKVKSKSSGEEGRGEFGVESRGL